MSDVDTAAVHLTDDDQDLIADALGHLVSARPDLAVNVTEMCHRTGLSVTVDPHDAPDEDES